MSSNATASAERSAESALHILQIETFGRGGLTHYVDNLSRALVALGLEVTVLTTADYELEAREPDGPKVERLLAPRTRLRKQQGKRSTGLLASLSRKLEAIQDAFRAASFAARRRPDVVHLHCTNPIALLYLLLLRLTSAFGSSFLVVATAHQITPHEPIPLQALVYRSIHRLCQRIVAHSEFDRQRLGTEFSIPASRVAVIPHGEYGFFAQVARNRAPSAARAQLGLLASDRVVLFFGYLREYKGLDLLLEAWPRVAASDQHARLVVAGDPVQLSAARREELEGRARQLGATTRFSYIPIEEVATYFTAADVLAMPYRKISQSGVLYLGLALGLPVVATRIGPWAELLSDGENALLVDPDSVSSLQQGLSRLLSDEALRRRLAEGGRRLAQEHSWPKIAEQTEALYRSFERS